MSNKQCRLSFIEKLKDISETSVDSLEKAVAIVALSYETPERILSFLNDLLQHGCIFGLVYIQKGKKYSLVHISTSPELEE